MLRCADLTRTHDGGVTPVRQVSLTVQDGEFVSIMGASGSGKTSLLAILGLLDTATSGTYEMMGEVVDGRSEAYRARVRSRTIGFVFQSFHLIPTLSAVENVALGALYTGLSRRTRLEWSRSALIEVGLEARLNALGATLSGGEQQRVAIARALVSRPAVLLCDEPTGNLDSENTARVMEILSNLNRGGLTILLVTHDPLVAGFAHSHYLMRDGQLMAPGEAM